MKCVAAVVMSLSAVVGMSQPQAGGEPAEERLPQGQVSVEYVPTILVEAKRWAAEDVAAEQSELLPRINEWVAALAALDIRHIFAR